MEIVRCEMGHFYDLEQSKDCPTCARERRQNVGDTGVVTGGGISWGLGGDMNVGEIFDEASGMRIYVQRECREVPQDFEPVMGWLVCTGGSLLGQSFELRRGFNHIFGGDTEPCVSKDLQWTDAACATIRIGKEEYTGFSGKPSNPVELIPGSRSSGGRAVRLNGTAISTRYPLSSGDRIRIPGFAEFMFTALCNEAFNWADQIPTIFDKDQYDMGDLDPEQQRRTSPAAAFVLGQMGESANDRWILLIRLPDFGQTVRICARSGHTVSQILQYMGSWGMLLRDNGEPYFRELEPWMEYVHSFGTTTLTLGYR